MKLHTRKILAVCGVVCICAAAMLLQGHILRGIAAPTQAEAAAPQSAAATEKVVYLTFDDGPSSVTEAVLDALKEAEVRATFFVIAAENNKDYMPLLQRTVEEGHLIALHSCTHDYKKIYASTDAFWNDLAQLQTMLLPYGCGDTKIMRFPGGSTNTVSRKYGGAGLMKTLMQQAQEKGYRYVDWNVTAEDSVGGSPSAQTICNRVIKGAKGKNSCVVLMHDSSINRATAQALPEMIRWFKDEGYRFDTLDHLAP